MKKYLIPGLTAMVLLLGHAALAQDEKEKDKDKEKEKIKASSNDEIIIRKKGDKDSKVTVEFKDGQVTVNGKPVDDYEDDNVSISRRKSVTVIGSPFRSQGGGWSQNQDVTVSGYGIASTAFLGVVTDKSGKGAKIEEVTKNSAAEKAGLQKGDVIMKIDDETIEDQADLSKAVRKHKPEEKVTITYERDGKTNKATATLGKRKTSTLSSTYGFEPNIQMAPFEAMPRINTQPHQFHFDNNLNEVIAYGRPRLGIKAQDTEDAKGVKVIDVDEESAADKAGIKENDIITEFDGKKVTSADELSKAAMASKEKTAVKVAITRDGKAQTIEIKTPRKLKTTNL
jgi:serine protease Do